MSYVAVVFVVELLIAIHEYGHLLAAKLCGIPIKRFSIGFGPKVFEFHCKSLAKWPPRALVLLKSAKDHVAGQTNKIFRRPLILAPTSARPSCASIQGCYETPRTMRQRVWQDRLRPPLVARRAAPHPPRHLSPPRSLSGNPARADGCVARRDLARVHLPFVSPPASVLSSPGDSPS